MKYYLLNPVFVEYQIEITNINAVSEIERKIEGVETGGYILVKVNKMFFKLILKEKDDEKMKFELTSNIYL